MLFGDVALSGRLPFTVFKSLDQMKSMEDCDLTTQPGRAHLYYDDSSVAKLGPPQHWFGFGLGYTEFACSDLKVTPTAFGGRCSAVATVTVANVGKAASREVAQLCLNRPAVPGCPRRRGR